MKLNSELYCFVLWLLTSTYVYADAGAEWYFLIRNTSGNSIEVVQQNAICETSKTSLPISIGPLDSKIIKILEVSKNGNPCTQAKEKKFVFTINGLAVTAYSCYKKNMGAEDCYVRDDKHLHNLQVTTKNNYNLSVSIRGNSQANEHRYVILDYKNGGDISLPIWCTALTANQATSQCIINNDYDHLTYHKGDPQATFKELIQNIDSNPHKINLLRT